MLIGLVYIGGQFVLAFGLVLSSIKVFWFAFGHGIVVYQILFTQSHWIELYNVDTI